MSRLEVLALLMCEVAGQAFYATLADRPFWDAKRWAFSMLFLLTAPLMALRGSTAEQKEDE